LGKERKRLQEKDGNREPLSGDKIFRKSCNFCITARFDHKTPVIDCLTCPAILWCRYEVPYSEHSSFTELKEFVKYIAPDNIIPSVNNDSAQAADNMVALLLNEDP
jgi:hypothetical protein